LHYGDLGFSVDISRLKFPDDFVAKMQPKIDKAFAAMRELEAGAIANPDEKRMVGHYWLRNPALTPSAELRADIEETRQKVCGGCSRRKNRGRKRKTLRTHSVDRHQRLGAWTAIRDQRARITARRNGHLFF
jgi:glucose-6-phosphate isomerase